MMIVHSMRVIKKTNVEFLKAKDTMDSWVVDCALERKEEAEEYSKVNNHSLIKI